MKLIPCGLLGSALTFATPLLAACTSTTQQAEARTVPTWEEFKQGATRVVQGKELYIIEWDRPVTLEELRAHYERSIATAPPDGTAGELKTVRSSLVVRRINGLDDVWSVPESQNLRYCVSTEFEGYRERAIHEMEAAAAAWEAVANLNFIYDPSQDSNCHHTNSNITFPVRPWIYPGAVANFPPRPGIDPRTIFINFYDLDNHYQTLAPDMTSAGVLTHELGHVLGFEHEYLRPEGACPSNSEDIDWRPLTPFDQMSIMSYYDPSLSPRSPSCRQAYWNGPVLTQRDAEGAQLIYGRKPPVPVPSSSLVNAPIPDFQSWATATSAVVTGDFDGDGKTDIAAVGAQGWGALPVALSNGNGSFRLVNEPIPNFQSWAAATRTIVTGDFNRDGWTDIAAVGAQGWSAVPVALSNGNGSFRLVNEPLPDFQSWAMATRTVVAGDFDGDGRTDLAAVGAEGWGALPVAVSNGNGAFELSNQPIADFQTWAGVTRTVVTGDFDADGRMDIAAVGAEGWTALPVVLFRP